MKGDHIITETRPRVNEQLHNRIGENKTINECYQSNHNRYSTSQLWDYGSILHNTTNLFEIFLITEEVSLN